MEQQFNTKRFWLSVGFVAILSVSTIYVVLRWRELFPIDEVSEIYMRYADRDGLNVAFVKDFKVNDSLFLDVTYIEATDSVTWDRLCKDFDIPPLSVYSQKHRDGLSTPHASGCFLLSDTVVKGGESFVEENFVVYSRAEKKLSFFHNVNQKSREALIYRQLDAITY